MLGGVATAAAVAATASPIGHIKQAITNIYIVRNIINTTAARAKPISSKRYIFFPIWKNRNEIVNCDGRRRKGGKTWGKRADQTRLRSRVAFYAIFPINELSFPQLSLSLSLSLSSRTAVCCVQCAVILQLCQRFYL